MEAISYITSAEGAFSTRIGLLLPLTVLEGRVLQIIKYVYSLDEIYEIQFFDQASLFPKVWLLWILVLTICILIKILMFLFFYGWVG